MTHFPLPSCSPFQLVIDLILEVKVETEQAVSQQQSQVAANIRDEVVVVIDQVLQPGFVSSGVVEQ